MRLIPCIRRKKRGQAAVESSLVLLILILLVVGVVDFGQLLFFLQTFTERAEAGTRYAVTNTFDATAVTNYVLYNSATAPSGNPPGLMGLTASEVAVNRYNAGDRINDRIEVDITNVPLRFYSLLITGSYAPRPFRFVRSVESLGVTN